MTPPPSGLPSISLREQHAFLRRLALGLVRDEAAADDLVQDAWVSALERPGRPVGVGWLVRAMRHLAGNARRGDARRGDRERMHAEGVDERLEDDVHERLALQSSVLDAVRGLPEPVRSSIYLHYCDESPVAAIAERFGVPHSTVKARLARGRELLREELDRRSGGDRRAWVLLLATDLARGAEAASGGPLSIPGAWWMSTWTKVAITAGALAAVALVAYAPEREGEVAVAPSRVEAAPDEPLLAPVERPRSPERAQVASRPAPEAPAEVAPEATPVAASAPVSFEGLVVDSRARPLAGVAVAEAGENGAVVTGRDGRFAWSGSRPTRLVVAEDPYVTLFSPLGSSVGSEDAVLVAERRAALRGAVVDEGGVGLSGALVELVLPDGFRRRFPMDLGASIELHVRTETAGDGGFELADVARVDGAQIVATLEGFVPRREPLSSLRDGSTLVLRRPGHADEVVFGLVLDELGLPVEGARVSFGADVTRTDELGVFWLPRNSDARAYSALRTTLGRDSRVLSAVAPGHLPAQLEVELDPTTGVPSWPDGLVLQLAGEPLSIDGHVVDPDGAGIPGISVYLGEASLFSMEEGSSSLENLLGGDPEERITLHTTDAGGGFVLGGLLPRAYPLVAFDRASGVQVVTEPVQAGESVEIVLDRSARWATLRGRVVSPFGDPLADVQVGVFRDATDFVHEGELARTTSWLLARTRTAADGTFELLELPKEHVYLRLWGSGILDTLLGLDEPLGDPALDAVDGLELVASRSARLRVRQANAGEAEEIGVLDTDGQPLTLRVHGPKPGPPRSRMPFHGDVTDVLAVDERAGVLVYYRGGEEVRRRPISLRHGELNEL